MLHGAVVIHIHPWLVGTLACAVDGKRIVRKLFGDAALWIGFHPGYELAKAVARELQVYRKDHGGKDPEYLIVENHGPFIPAPRAGTREPQAQALRACFCERASGNSRL